MKRTIRAVAFISLLLGAFFIALQYQAVFWTPAYARKCAFSDITERCISDGRDPKLLASFHETAVGGSQWAFEATYQGKPRYLYGVWFTRSGTPEFYEGDPDDSQSAAYDKSAIIQNESLQK